MILAAYKYNNDIESGIYKCSEKYFDKNLPKGAEIIVKIPLVVRGKTYKERQSSLYNTAVEYSHCWGEIPCLSYGEIFILDDFFERNGKRYGLYAEFKDNAIC